MRLELRGLGRWLLLHRLFRPKYCKYRCIGIHDRRDIHTVTNTTFPCIFRSLKLEAPEKKIFKSHSAMNHGTILIKVQRYGTELIPSKRACAAI